MPPLSVEVFKPNKGWEQGKEVKTPSPAYSDEKEGTVVYMLNCGEDKSTIHKKTLSKEEKALTPAILASRFDPDDYALVAELTSQDPQYVLSLLTPRLDANKKRGYVITRNVRVTHVSPDPKKK